ncbi:TonB-linked outer membrane protein, SusC/RagA family [Catalinimonas alkaloidigena]|uniref:TonB-linked outer membrane protein, SusC/RagA family n=1 Tax=Catalinimonas alkaloidigena TaxID=1075417 RepID=A0A1G9SEQ2_9BACT|nr:TonB-dependent receptor [Catalinimonas alkaloidigena]SDM33871.1 TonB-linked outer membrane protein, SusC/RagA family [Catalinimonas alkaloidigena]
MNTHVRTRLFGPGCRIVLIWLSCLGLWSQPLRAQPLPLAFYGTSPQQDPNAFALTLRNARLPELFRAIEARSGYRFAYTDEVAQLDQTFSIVGNHLTLKEVLSQLQAEAPLRFRQREELISVALERPGVQPKAVERDVTGRVHDEAGEPIPGVSVLVKGSTLGTITDIDGRFVLRVQDEGTPTLVISFVGYQTQELTLGTQNELDVTLFEDVQSLNEIVVVGYGTQKKANLTGAVSQVEPKDIERRPNPNLTQSLQGTMPGLNIARTSGNPGATPRINIRGFTSINGGNPLVLVDGVEGDINKINPNDVESVTVLKDAAASAIYGARGSFGVILVTTKAAQSGRMRVSYSNNFAWQTTTTNTDFVKDPYLATQLVDESFRVSTGRNYTGYNAADYEELQRRSTDPSLPDVVVDNRGGRDQYIYYGNTDWWNTMFRKWQPTQTHNLSLTGGTDRLSVLLSGRFYKQLGILNVQKDTYDSYNARGKVDLKVNDWLTLSENLQVNTSDQLSHGGSMYGWGEPWGSLIWVHALPSYVPQNPDGTATFRTELNNYTIGDGVFASLLYGKSIETIGQQQLINTVGATLAPTPVPGLSVKFNYTNRWDFLQQTQRSTLSPWSIYPDQISYLGNDQLRKVSGFDTYTALNLYANYEHNAGRHHFKEMVGVNREYKKYTTQDARKKNNLSDDLNELDLGSSDPEAYGTASEWAIRGYFFRVNYDFDNRYLLEVNGRYDGTSRFPSQYRWGFFPSVSAGWNVSNEPFLSGLKNVFDELKFRASYGGLGNQQVGTYAYIPTLNKATSGSYAINGSKLEYITPPGLNPVDITWERVTTTNVGMDVAVLRNRLSANVDVFQRNTIGMLTQGRTLPAVLGTGSPQENAADLRTRGFELTLTYQQSIPLGNKPLHLVFTGNLANQLTKITRFDNPNNYLGDYYVGQTIGEIWGYHIDGLFQSDQEASDYPVDQRRVNGRINSSPGENGHLLAGDMKFADLNGDGEISQGNNTLANPGDRRIIGNAAPQLPYSFSVRADWNNFDFSVFFQGIGKQDWYPGNDSRLFWAMYCRPYVSFIRKDLVDEIWTPENPDAYFPRLRGYTALSSGSELYEQNDRYLQNVAYLRLKNLSIGYTFPTQLTQRVHLDRVRIYISGENLLTFSKLTDYVDPEAASSGVDLSRTVTADDRSNAQTYPFSKAYSFGLSVNF